MWQTGGSKREELPSSCQMEGQLKIESSQVLGAVETAPGNLSTPHQMLTSHRNPANGVGETAGGVRGLVRIIAHPVAERPRYKRTSSSRIFWATRLSMTATSRSIQVLVYLFSQPRRVKTLRRDCCSQILVHLKFIDALPRQDSNLQRNPSPTLAQLRHPSTSHFHQDRKSVV